MIMLAAFAGKVRGARFVARGVVARGVVARRRGTAASLFPQYCGFYLVEHSTQRQIFSLKSLN
jgi:hypothetical protein